MLEARTGGLRGAAWILGAVLIAIASLPFGRALAFDASAWVVWGREIWSLSLDTNAGPSFKPFPLLVTGPAAILGDGAALAWLVVARAGALLAVVGAARLAGRAAGWPGALVAAGAVALSPWWLPNAALGNADPLLGALVVWALLAADDGDHRLGFGLTALGALVRPEIWPFLGLYGLWAIGRGRLRAVPVIATGAAVLVVWIVPDLLSSGLASTRGATGTASAGSAALTDVPFLTVWEDLGRQAPWPVLAIAVVAGLAAAGGTGPGLLRRGRIAPGPTSWLLLALGYALLVAVMAQAGFAGNPRYLVPALTLLAATAGAALAVVEARGGGVRRAASGRGRAAPVVALLLLAALVAIGQDELRDGARLVDARAAARVALQRAIDDAGGAVALRRCGPVRSGPGPRTLVAELVDEPITAAARRPDPTGAAIVARPGGGWVVRPARCP